MPGAMQTIHVQARELSAIMKTIPYLLAGKEGPGFVQQDGIERLGLHGVYTLDGECFSRHRGPIQVDCSPRRVRGVRLGD